MRIVPVVILAVLAGCGTTSRLADPGSDAPESGLARTAVFVDVASYESAIATWRSFREVNAWIGAKFQYDLDRAVQLSETQRRINGRMPIPAPEAFFESPRGVCVDLARFAVETVRAISPEAKPTYLTIEFDPASLRGNTLRLHWIASLESDGQYYFFADSKRPGHLAGPYRTAQDFITEYAIFRGRRIVAYRFVDSFEARRRTRSARQSREPG